MSDDARWSERARRLLEKTRHPEMEKEYQPIKTPKKKRHKNYYRVKISSFKLSVRKFYEDRLTIKKEK